MSTDGAMLSLLQKIEALEQRIGRFQGIEVPQTVQAVKGWVLLDGASGAILASLNVSSVDDLGGSGMRVNWDTDFATANYGCVATAHYTPGGTTATTVSIMTSLGAASMIAYVHRVSDGVHLDPTAISVIALGAQ